MKKLQITKGKWIVSKSEVDSSSRGCYRVDTDSRPSQDELEANSQLIAEAGTVANETGKTPRELVEDRNYWKRCSDESDERIIELEQQNKELLEALIGMVKNFYVIADARNEIDQEKAMETAENIILNYS